MSDTPRTDEVDARNKEVHIAFYEMRSHAWQLERELAEVKAQRDSLENEIEGWRNKWECAIEMAARAEVQRDSLKEELRDARLIWAKYEDRYFEAREQRDKLAEALEMVRDADDDCYKDGLPTIPPVARHEIDQSLAFVAEKDPHRFCRTTSHCGCRYNS